MDRLRSTQARASETVEETAARRDVERLRSSQARASETVEETAARRDVERLRSSQARTAETLDETVERRDTNRRRMAVTRAGETIIGDFSQNCADIHHRTWLRLGFFYDHFLCYAGHPSVSLGRMNVTCQFCGAKKWLRERPGICCLSGKISLPKLNDPPELLRSLLSGPPNVDTRHFAKNIRKYNSAFQMTSFGANEQHLGGFMPTFKVQGQIYHTIGSLLPPQGQEHKFLQIYFMGDSAEECTRRCSVIDSLRRNIVERLQTMLHVHNTYVRSFKTALDAGDVPDLRLKIDADRTPQGEHPRRFNAPTTNEVAVLIAGDTCENRDVVLRLHDSTLKHIPETHRSYDALQYPLLFPCGDDGYHFQYRQINPTTTQETTKKVSAMTFYAYRIMVRDDSFNTILKCRQLFHQYVVDMYVKIETERLKYIRFNQKRLRAENYVHLCDAMRNDQNPATVGQSIILPSSFTGSPRYMKEKTQDAMTYVRERGRPQLFITFTCNPTWPEITAELFDGQTAQDRNDLIARVFHMRAKAFIDVVTKGQLFGKTTCHMYTVEWQKRGLPHVHALFWLKDKITGTKIDDAIRAELPLENEDPELHEMVKRHMIHGPCGRINPNAPCMKDGKCTKRFPRHLLNDTQTDVDGYPLYRRRSREEGGTFTVLHVRQMDVEIDNRWVVPYNPVLTKMFNAHINVECCNSVKSIKYITKYVNKGSDQAVFGVQNEHDEVSRYETGRYMSSSEAVWRILEFPIHERYPPVIHLSVHLENGQRVYFTEENAREVAETPTDTTLTAYFKLNAEDAFARTLLYNEVPAFFTFDSKGNKFKRRQRGEPVNGHDDVRRSDVLGRVYTVHPRHAECYFLRLLLHNVKGATSFDALRVVDGCLCATNREACQRLGLLQDDVHWRLTLSEACESRMPRAIRHLFAIMLSFCEIADPLALWESFRDHMAEDFLHSARQHEQNDELELSAIELDRCLTAIGGLLHAMSGRTLAQVGLPQPLFIDDASADALLTRESTYNEEILATFVAEREPTLTDDQRVAYEGICNRLESGEGGILFLDAPGGTGKTYLINLLLAKVRSRSQVALAVASSGIAATLLEGGRTAHSMFALPLDLQTRDEPMCAIKHDSDKACLMRQVTFIVWDECTMSHKKAFEAVDRTLRDIRSSQTLMGGVTVVLSGDFRQTLPVIPRGTPADEIFACVKSSYLWRQIRTYSLTTNMRVQLSGNEEVERFTEELLNVGNGNNSSNTLFHFTDTLAKVVSSKDELIANVYTDFEDNYHNMPWLKERAVLAPLNDTVEQINCDLLSKMPGHPVVYLSVNSVEDDDSGEYPVEFLNSCKPPGVAPHVLSLKVGAPVMLLRNLDAPKLCNGTRLVVSRLQPNVIEAKIMTGSGAGENVYIPKVPMNSTALPFLLKRVQFPLRLCFGMTINKSQGQSLKVAGLDLSTPCFAHGQLYVGCSRVGSPDNLFVLCGDGSDNCTKNIVYPAALQ